MTLDKDKVFSAVWAGLATITYKFDDGVTEDKTVTYRIESDVKILEAPKREDYTFQGWYDGDGNRYEAEGTLHLIEDITLTAKWVKNTPDTPSHSGGSSSGSTTYTVSTPKADHGTVKVSPSNASKGRTVTITVTPDEGYALKSLVVTDAKGNEIELTDKGDGKFTFTMPASKVTVKAVFEETGDHDCPSEKFDDVDTSAWYHEAVDYVITEGMMNGTSADTFEPNAATTRGMIVTILYRLEGSPKAGKAAFEDVAAGAWYADSVAWATANGIVKGYGNGKFGPEDAITREQVAAILYRYAGYKGYDVTKTADLTVYNDAASVSAYAETAMSWAVAEGLFQGVGADLLSPATGATRCQIATVLMRFCENVAE